MRGNGRPRCMCPLNLRGRPIGRLVGGLNDPLMYVPPCGHVLHGFNESVSLLNLPQFTTVWNLGRATRKFCWRTTRFLRNAAAFRETGSWFEISVGIFRQCSTARMFDQLNIKNNRSNGLLHQPKMAKSPNDCSWCMCDSLDANGVSICSCEIKLASVIQWGTWQKSVWTPFGITNAPATFHRDKLVDPAWETFAWLHVQSHQRQTKGLLDQKWI